LEEKQTQEPTCKSCGSTGWKPSTRREFIQRTVVVGVGLTAALAMGTASSPAIAAPRGVCGDLHKSCMANCNLEDNIFERIACKLECNAAYLACEAEAIAQGLMEAFDDATKWLYDNREAIIGTIIVIGVIALIVIVVPGGGAALAFV